MKVGDVKELIKEIEFQRNNYMRHKPAFYPDNVMIHPDWKASVSDYFSKLYLFDIDKCHVFGIKVIWTTQVRPVQVQLTIDCN